MPSPLSGGSLNICRLLISSSLALNAAPDSHTSRYANNGQGSDPGRNIYATGISSSACSCEQPWTVASYRLYRAFGCRLPHAVPGPESSFAFSRGKNQIIHIGLMCRERQLGRSQSTNSKDIQQSTIWQSPHCTYYSGTISVFTHPASHIRLPASRSSFVLSLPASCHRPGSQWRPHHRIYLYRVAERKVSRAKSLAWLRRSERLRPCNLGFILINLDGRVFVMQGFQQLTMGYTLISASSRTTTRCSRIHASAYPYSSYGHRLAKSSNHLINPYEAVVYDLLKRALERLAERFAKDRRRTDCLESWTLLGMLHCHVVKLGLLQASSRESLVTTADPSAMWRAMPRTVQGACI